MNTFSFRDFLRCLAVQRTIITLVVAMAFSSNWWSFISITVLGIEKELKASIEQYEATATAAKITISLHEEDDIVHTTFCWFAGDSSDDKFISISLSSYDSYSVTNKSSHAVSVTTSTSHRRQRGGWRWERSHRVATAETNLYPSPGRAEQSPTGFVCGRRGSMGIHGRIWKGATLIQGRYRKAVGRANVREIDRSHDTFWYGC